jgi:hypothetical protein
MADHCCDMMASNVSSTCHRHASHHDCLIDYWPDTHIYGIIVHESGSRMIVISHCPWCGTDLTAQPD